MCMRILGLLLALIACTLPAHAARFAKRGKYEVIGYIFGPGKELDASVIAAQKMTRIIYAFFALKNGVIAEREEHDAENLAILTGLRKANPQLQILVSVETSDQRVSPIWRSRGRDATHSSTQPLGPSRNTVCMVWTSTGSTRATRTSRRQPDERRIARPTRFCLRNGGSASAAKNSVSVARWSPLRPRERLRYGSTTPTCVPPQSGSPR